MNSSKGVVPQAVSGGDQVAGSQRKRTRVPKHARPLRGMPGLVRECHGCGMSLITLGLGRPREYCEECRAAVYTFRQAVYYNENRERLLKKLNEKRFKERQERGRV